MKTKSLLMTNKLSLYENLNYLSFIAFHNAGGQAEGCRWIVHKQFNSKAFNPVA
ncbi:MAG: hypothetical protein K9L78_02595 [Victivallales bacterium]|nr:hypothetical protein [Victivallales bacterium]MCF7888985.1 hypothetical protein [Victivallales bacterium]